MQTIASNNIPVLFTAYGIEIAEGYNESRGKAQKIVRRIQYWCRRCKTGFVVDHNYHGMLGNYSGFSDSIVYCPNCGHRHENWWNGPRYIYIFASGEREQEKRETAPLSVDITVKEGKELLVLYAKFRTARFLETEDGERYGLELGERREEFRFNLRRRAAEFVVREGKGHTAIKRYDLGDPFDGSVFKDSLLLQIDSSNHSEKFRDGTVSLMRTLRERLRKKWKKIHGHDLGSVHVGYGKTYGRMLFPLVNMAYRLAYADTDNLPAPLNRAPHLREAWAADRVITAEAREKFGDLDAIRRARDSVSGIIGLFGMPDRPAVRKLLSMDIFSAAELSEILKVTDNMDYAKALWHLMQEKPRAWYGYHESGRIRAMDLPEMYGFLRELAAHYPVRSIIAHVRRTNWQEMGDARRMLQRLLPERLEAFWRDRPKLKDLHDALVQATKHQREEGFALQVPEHVRRRLTMQLDQLHFFLPEHSRELMEIGDVLHNCVRTYDDAMRAQKCNIVPVTDDNGKLVACLEVQGNTLAQAKLKHNRPVLEDKALNDEVVRWAEKTGLSIKTGDIRKEAEAAPGRTEEREILLLPEPRAAMQA